MATKILKSEAKKAPAKKTKDAQKEIKAVEVANIIKSAAAQRAAKADGTNAEERKTFWAQSGYKGISRIDHEKRNTHGWYVRVSFGGVMYSKFFSDNVHGGPQKALNKAVKHRNQTEREIGKPRTDRVISAAKARNKTGILGVQRINKGAAGAWQVTWSPAPGELKRTSVSVAKYGEEEAFKRACRIRRQKERAVFGGVISRDEVALPEVNS